MRDPLRIHRVMAALADLWHQQPDQRLGQLVLNLTRNAHGATDKDLCWTIEDNELLKRILQERGDLAKP